MKTRKMASSLPISVLGIKRRLATYPRVFGLPARSVHPPKDDKQYYISVLSPRLDGDVTKSGGKQGTSVGSDGSGDSMQTDYSGYIKLCKLIRSISGAERNEVSNLG